MGHGRPAGGRLRPGVATAAAEKKIAILEQALAHHPGSDELLLALLGATEAAAPAEEVPRPQSLTSTRATTNNDVEGFGARR